MVVAGEIGSAEALRSELTALWTRVRKLGSKDLAKKEGGRRLAARFAELWEVR